MSWLGFERAQLPEIAEKLTNASGDVEERRFQRRVNALKSVRASAPVVASLIHDEFFRNLFKAVPPPKIRSVALRTGASENGGLRRSGGRASVKHAMDVLEECIQQVGK
jgi:hypothetical protein